jgi:ureidoglycolate lyase
MPGIERINVQGLTREAYEPFGWVLGARPFSEDRDCYSDSEQAIAWHGHNFDAGEAGVVEFVWAHYKWCGFSLLRLECHRLTQQAIIPVTGDPIVQVVSPPPIDPMAPDLSPDLDRIMAFLLDGTKGVCMRRGCWHWQLPLVDQATYLVVTRRSTTMELWNAKYSRASLTETVRKQISDLTGAVFELVL